MVSRNLDNGSKNIKKKTQAHSVKEKKNEKQK